MTQWQGLTSLHAPNFPNILCNISGVLTQKPEGRAHVPWGRNNGNERAALSLGRAIHETLHA